MKPPSSAQNPKLLPKNCFPFRIVKIKSLCGETVSTIKLIASLEQERPAAEAVYLKASPSLLVSMVEDRQS